jgi:hypothetical protein
VEVGEHHCGIRRSGEEEEINTKDAKRVIEARSRLSEEILTDFIASHRMRK